jgi:hypothetical protein
VAKVKREADALVARRLLLKEDAIAYVSAAQKDEVKKRFPLQK